MNPYELPQKPERKAYHNLDASQSSSVSIKIFNKNDDNVVIRLYRNSKKGNRDRFRNSFGHPRQAAGRGGETGKSKPTMLRNLYRNTFGPTLDETVLVGMETFQLCQHNNSPNGQTFEETTTSTENLRSIIPNELSWDCSTLLPTNVNLKQYENVCTSTSNCLLDKDPNLSSLVTNHCQYCPASSDAYCQVLHDFTPSAEAIKSFTEQNQIPGHISSHENLTLRPNSRRRSLPRKSLNKEELPREEPGPHQKRRTAVHRTRKCSGQDSPSPRNSFGEEISNRPDETSQPSNYFPEMSENGVAKKSRRRSFEEEEVSKENKEMCNCCPVSEAILESTRKLSASPTAQRNSLNTSIKEEMEVNPRRNSFRDPTLPRVSTYRERATSAQSFEDNKRRSSANNYENLEQSHERPSMQQRTVSAGAPKEEPRRSNAEAADFIRKNSRRNSPPTRSSIKGYIRTELPEDLSPISSSIPAKTNETFPAPKRNSRSSDPPPPEEPLRPTNGTPRNSFVKERVNSIEEKPVTSTISPEVSGYSGNKDAKNRRPSTSKDRPSLSVSRKSGELDKTESDECRCTKLECCGCEKEGTSGRNKIPQETRYAITRVTKYDDYTTYEILKSTRAVPRKIPEVLEKIFIEKDK